MCNKAATCRTCNSQFQYVVKTGLNPPMYCSTTCKPVATGLCSQCGDKCNGALCRKCYYKNKAVPSRQCEVCGKEFRRSVRAGDSARACSRTCGFVIYAKMKFAQARKSQDKEAAKLIASIRPCAVCGFYHAGYGQTCRLQECKREFARRTSLLTSTGSWENRLCEGCGVEVPSVKRSKYTCRPKRCSKCQCAHRLALRREAKARLLEPNDLLKRIGRDHATLDRISSIVRAANGQCPLCGLTLSTECDPSHDRHVELDHKLPRSEGGTDDFTNLRAICRKCNGFKSDFVSPELVLTPSYELPNNSLEVTEPNMHPGGVNSLGV
jgi:hypothetical protein